MAKEDRSVLGWFAFVVSVTALALAMFGLRSSSASGATDTATSASATVDVVLSEFKISPAMITLPLTGGTLRITNNGTMAHNFSVPQLGLKVGDINPGATTELKVGPVAAGMYDALCEIAGHAANGMKASVMIGGTT
ncbi:MAG: cupredoxin domain-containing protein, partial [Ilumatobacteraceae bacterium]